MIKKILLASCLLVASMASQAALISYNGYERDTAKNYVTGGGLEWLMWDVTKGLSINEALAAHGADGWVLASNVQMASLFNVFLFGKVDWVASENMTQGQSTPWDVAEEGNIHLKFMQMFGQTRNYGAPNYDPNDTFRGASALFGSDSNNDGYYNLANVRDDYTNFFRDRFGATAYLEADWREWTTAYRENGLGVALVKEVRVDPPTQVSLPGSLSLLALGFLALGFRRRKA